MNDAEAERIYGDHTPPMRQLPGKTKAIRLRRWTVFRELDGADGDYCAPIDVGGTCRSHHSGDLIAMFRKGFVDRKRRWVGCSGGSWLYRRTIAGDYLRLAIVNQFHEGAAE